MDRELLGSLHPDDIDHLIAKLADCHAGLMAEIVTVMREVIERELWKADGARSAAAWAAERFRMAENDARRLCRVAKALEQQERPVHAALDVDR